MLVSHLQASSCIWPVLYVCSVLYYFEDDNNPYMYISDCILECQPYWHIFIVYYLSSYTHALTIYSVFQFAILEWLVWRMKSQVNGDSGEHQLGGIDLKLLPLLAGHLFVPVV